MIDIIESCRRWAADRRSYADSDRQFRDSWVVDWIARDDIAVAETLEMAAAELRELRERRFRERDRQRGL